MSALASRRDTLATLAGFLAVPVAAAPALAVQPSDLARACDWAVGHMAWINDPRHPDKEWPDERLEAEIDRFDAVLRRAADEPSTSLTDIRAKARLILTDRVGDLTDPEAPDFDRALLALLKEVIALCA